MKPAVAVPAGGIEGAVQPYAMPPAPNAHYGTQRRVVQAAGQAKPAQLLEAGPTQLLWRVTAYATNATFALEWGTYANHRLEGLLSPLAISIPGRFSLLAVPVDDELAVSAQANLSVSSGGLSVARGLQTTLGALSPYVGKVVALAASTVSVGGSAVVLTPGQTLDVAAPAVLTAGGPLLVEYAL